MGDLEDALAVVGAVLVDETDAAVVEAGELLAGEGAGLAAVVLAAVLEPDLQGRNGCLVSGEVQRRRGGGGQGQGRVEGHVVFEDAGAVGNVPGPPSP